MKRSVKLLIALIIMVFIFSLRSSAQDIKGGTIKYEQFTRFDVSVFGKDSKITEWLSGMPTGQRSAKVLYFNKSNSLYVNDLTSESIVIDPRVKVMTEKIAYFKPPTPEVKRVYMDLAKNKMTEQVEFMTRFFIVEKDIESMAWKTGSNQRKIQGYICQEGVIKRGEEVITAWFTPEIPVPLGPENYRGLPGMILAIDINGINVLLATSVDLDSPVENPLTRPSNGKKMKQEQFDRIVAEKADEFKKVQKSTATEKR